MMEETHVVVTKLYGGLMGRLVYGTGDEDEETLDRYQLKKYEFQIRKAIRENFEPENRAGLAEYLENPVVREKIASAFPTVEVWDQKLWGVLEIKSLEPLQPKEISYLRQEWRGQITDGWGEGFVQREIPCGKGEHLFLDFACVGREGIRTETELKGTGQEREASQISQEMG